MTDAAMESTGVYWWPVYHALAQAGPIEVCVCNAAHMRNVPGRKTDIKDCQWIAELHEHGLLRPSFIPGQQVAALRARTRYRKKLIEHRASEGQRLSKVLEDAGIKIDSVASELLGVSGRDMVEALIAGERDPFRLAGLARGRLRAKLDDLEMACDGRFTAGHAQLCRIHLDAYDLLTTQIATLDQLVATAAEPFEAVIARLVTIPGIGPRIAQVIVAETGGDMARFASSARLAAWAGLAPGDNESAGKRKKAAARKGNPHLRAAMVEASMGRLPHRQPARGPVPAADPPVRQAQHQEGRSRRRSHPAMHRLGGHEARQRLRRGWRRLLRPAGPAQPRAPRPPPPAGPRPAGLPDHPDPARRRQPATQLPAATRRLTESRSSPAEPIEPASPALPRAR